MNILGYFHGIDPAACLLSDGRLVAYSEEERLIRHKHAPQVFPIRSIDHCLKKHGIGLDEIDYIAYGWDVPRYANGSMRQFFDGVNAKYPPDQATQAWQNQIIGWFDEAGVPRTTIERILADYPSLHIKDIITWWWNMHEVMVVDRSALQAPTQA